VRSKKKHVSLQIFTCFWLLNSMSLLISSFRLFAVLSMEVIGRGMRKPISKKKHRFRELQKRNRGRGKCRK
jgi:hypothetical protein